ncbi:MAG: hypothetical protein IPK71_07635 [Myxococcales bacterium]|jgi:hypothetical protein|nr:hypothetical protein [Myxococcales bacterium]
MSIVHRMVQESRVADVPWDEARAAKVLGEARRTIVSRDRRRARTAVALGLTAALALVGMRAMAGASATETSPASLSVTSAEGPLGLGDAGLATD